MGVRRDDRRGCCGDRCCQESRRRGRPRKNNLNDIAPDTIAGYWRVTYSLHDLDQTAIDERLKEKATYVLIRTRDNDWQLDDADMIPAYRRQYVIEQGFSWLKSTAVINPMYLHTPHRIAALGFIYCIGLMTWNLIQRNVRAFLKANQRGLPYHHGKNSDNITTRFLFELFASLATATIQQGTNLILPRFHGPGVKQLLARGGGGCGGG